MSNMAIPGWREGRNLNPKNTKNTKNPKNPKNLNPFGQEP